MNKEAGNNELAAAHVGHPAAEGYSLITGEKEHDAELDEKLDKDLTACSQTSSHYLWIR